MGMHDVETGFEPNTIATLQGVLTVWLRARQIPEPARDAELLLRSVLGQDRAFLIAHPREPVPDAVRDEALELARRRAAGEPIQYLLGEWEFWRDTFAVTPDVLIPRPETELLVEQGARFLAGLPSPWILDLAAGSGCVGLSLLRELPSARVVAVDMSGAALRVAAGNAARLRLGERWWGLRADGLAALRSTPAGFFRLIAANPPYIAEDRYGELPAEVRDWEPRLALAGGSDGLRYYRDWIPAALERLRPGGHLLMEFGYGQWDALREILTATGERFELFHDLAGHPRVFHLRKD
jgi:release factor glutamine methyltransferase